jgi:exodeoxyribonuclease VII small subunit
MANDPQKFDITQSVNRLEEINAWFQNEDFNLDEGLQKLREGKDLIKQCRSRLKAVENEFTQIKQDFAEETEETVVEVSVTEQQKVTLPQRTLRTKEINPEDVPF